MNKYYKELSKQKQIIEDMGYKVAYICLYGSQNYGLDINTEEYHSDIDMKAIIVPTLKDLINNSKPISTVIDTEWGQCDLKDIRIYFDKGILKANPVYIETLYTDYYIIDELFKTEFEYIRSKRDKLVSTLKYQMLRAMYGMMCEKRKALCHPYPTIKDKIDKYGYDGKQLHHIYRIFLMMEDYFILGKDYRSCLNDFNEWSKQLLIELKMNKLNLEKAIDFADFHMDASKNIKESELERINENLINYSVRDELREMSKDIIYNKIVNDIRSSRMRVL